MIRSRHAFERRRTVATVIFTKTGTLTSRKSAVIDSSSHRARVWSRPSHSRRRSKTGTEHQIAHAIVRPAAEQSLPLPMTKGITTLPGRRVPAQIEGHTVRVGRLSFLEQLPEWLILVLTQ